MLVSVDALTVAFTAPNQTILFAGVVLNPDPLMVTVEPIVALAGAKEVITGTAFAIMDRHNKRFINTIFIPVVNT
jgi:hypothetical protein